MANNYDIELFPVEHLGLYGYIDGEGNQVIGFEYEETEGFFNGLAKVKRGSKWGYINERGDVVVPCQYDDIWSFSDGLARVRAGDKNGYVNTSGQVIIRCIYDDADDFMYGFARVQKSGRWGHIDTQGKEITSCKYDDTENYQDGLSRVCNNGKIGFVNTNGQEVIPLQFDWAELFTEGLSFVKVGTKYGYINTTGKIIIPLQFEDATDFANGIAIVKKIGKYGVIDKSGREVVPYVYEELSKAKELLCKYRSRINYGLTDNNKKTISFVNSLFEAIKLEMREIPYQINLLDEVHLKIGYMDGIKNVKENAHSRILKRILEYDKQGYDTFKSFLSFLGFRFIEVNEPKFRLEVPCPTTKGRIDLLVQERGRFAIIIENKINDADDQPNQLARYIEHLQSWYGEKQIYVVYLSPDGSSPAQQSWISNEGMNYQERYRERIAIISYSSIKEWLRLSVLPFINEHEVQYKSAIAQYVDYLDGFYEGRNINQTARAKLSSLLRSRLGKEVTADAIEKEIDRAECTELLDFSTAMSDINEIILSIDNLKTKCSQIEEVVQNVASIKDLLDRLSLCRRNALRQNVRQEGLREIDSEKIQGRLNYLGYEVQYNNVSYYIYIGHNQRYLFCSATSVTKSPITPIKLLNAFQPPLLEGDYWIATACNDGDYYTALNVLNNVITSIQSANRND